MPTINSDFSLVQVAVNGAADLARKVDPIWRDKNDTKKGWRIHYAVDIDVIKLAIDPVEMSAYAAVFSESEDVISTQEVLARCIGEYIFSKFSSEFNTASVDGRMENKEPFLIVPPHDEELDGVLFAIARKLKLKQNSVEKEIKSLKSALDKVKTNQDRVNLLLNHAPQTMLLLSGGTGANIELDRYASIVANQLTNLHTYAENDSTFPLIPQDPIKFSANLENKIDLSTNNHIEYAEFISLFDMWRERISEVPHVRSRRADLIANDAFVLARIEFINRRLCKDKRRIVLLTGTDSLHKAAKTYFIDGKSFKDIYLRAPISVVGCDDFFSEKNNNTNTKIKLADWFKVLFPNAIKVDGNNVPILLSNELTKAVNSILVRLKNNTNEIKSSHFSSLVNEWCQQINDIGVMHEISDIENSKRMINLLADLNQTSSAKNVITVEYLLMAVKSRVTESLRALYTNTMRLGVMQLGHDDGKEQKFYGLPALVFDDDFFQANAVCKQMYDALLSLGEDERKVNLSLLYETLRKIDNIDYHAMLIHGLIYASKGHWHATKILSMIALQSADSLPAELKKGRLGREAAYLQAIAVRRLARSADDLQEARFLLEEAQKRETLGVRDDPRFKSEALAQWVTNLQFILFDKKDDIRVRKQLDKDFDQKWSEAIFLSTIEASKYASVKEHHPIQRWLQRQNATNALLLALLYAQVDESVIERLKKQVIMLSDQFANWKLAPTLNSEFPGKDIYRDAISDFIYAITVSIFSDDQAIRKNAYELARESRPNVMTPIDDLRFTVFFTLATKRMNLSREDF